MYQLSSWENPEWAWVDDIFLETELDNIINIYSNKKSIKGKTEGKTEKPRRTNEIIKVESDDEWIYERLANATNHLNQYFNFDLTHIENAQIAKYKDSEYYAMHKDAGYRKYVSRKLSIVVMLSDEADYEGGDLLLYADGMDNPMQMDKKRGRVFGFPSYTLHEVTPVTKGTRFTLVTAVHGPRFK